MTQSSLYSTHVADHTRHRKPIGYHFCVGARAGGRAPRVNCGPMYQNLTEILPAPIFRSAAPTPPGSGNWRTAIERPQTLALAVRRLLQWGHTGLLNFCRTILAAGKPTFLPLVQHPQKSGRSGFHTFSFSPVLCSSVAHESNNGRRTRRDVGAVRQGQGSE